MHPLELTPLEATKNLLDVSVTERGTFRGCRRRWHLTTIENLESKFTDQIALSFGTGMHSAMEAYYSKGKDPQLTLEAFFKWAEQTKELTEAGPAWDALMDHIDLGEQMLTGYMKFDPVAKVSLGKPLAVEGKWINLPGHKRWMKVRPEGYPATADVVRSESGRLAVPIVDPATKTPITRGHHRPMLTGKIDLLSERATPKKGLWITDHKNMASPSPDAGLDFDDQITGYCYIVWRWTGSIPRGVVFNQLLKKLPKEPRFVKGKRKDEGTVLSTAKDQLTTPDMYRQALKDEGLMAGGKITSEPHAECLAALLARGWDPFFLRYEATRNIHQLMEFERRLIAEYTDMETALDEYEDSGGVSCYPNPDIRKCPYCPVKTLCLAMEDGSDVEDILESQFQEAPDRKAVD